MNEEYKKMIDVDFPDWEIPYKFRYTKYVVTPEDLERLEKIRRTPLP